MKTLNATSDPEDPTPEPELTYAELLAKFKADRSSVLSDTATVLRRKHERLQALSQVGGVINSRITQLILREKFATQYYNAETA